MAMPHRKLCVLGLSFLVTHAAAAPLYLPPGSNLTFGELTHSQTVVSVGNNPGAAAAFVARARELGNPTGGMAGSLAIGVEYGNVEEVFDTIDELADLFSPSAPGLGGGPGQNPALKPPEGVDIGGLIDLVDMQYPELEPLLEEAQRRVAATASLLTLIRDEGYARAIAAADMPVLIGRDLLGGSFTFGIGWSGTAKSEAFADAIEFDVDDALDDLLQQLQGATLVPGQQPTLFDVVGDVDFAVDPNDRSFSMVLDNDSLLLTKASQMSELGVGYSRRVVERPRGGLFVGVEAKYYNLELSRVSVRFGDITDSEELFEEIADADFRSDTNFGVDLGVLWTSTRYQLGATLTNVNEPEFQYPAVDLTPYSSAPIIDQLLEDEVYTMESQLRLEASVFTESRRWAMNVGIDANAAPDPVGDEFQWATISGGLTLAKRWVPSFRFGYRQNLTGSEIRYVSAGISLFRFFNFDVAAALDEVTIDGDELPQGAMMNLGFLFNF